MRDKVRDFVIFAKIKTSKTLYFKGIFEVTRWWRRRIAHDLLVQNHMDWLGEMSFDGRMPRTHKRAFLWPNGIYFLPNLAVGALMTGAAVPTPSILYSTDKSDKICGKRKIIHSKCC